MSQSATMIGSGSVPARIVPARMTQSPSPGYPTDPGADPTPSPDPSPVPDPKPKLDPDGPEPLPGVIPTSPIPEGLASGVASQLA
jgi:hypothetical protein